LIGDAANLSAKRVCQQVRRVTSLTTSLYSLKYSLREEEEMKYTVPRDPVPRDPRDPEITPEIQMREITKRQKK